MTAIFTPAFLLLTATLAAASYLIGLMLDLMLLKLVAKTLPVLCLVCWVWPGGDRRIAWGLLCGALGDFFLALPNAFLPGMIAFAAGHALYVRAFFAWQPVTGWSLALPVVLYLVTPMVLMLPGAGALAVPVAVYMLIIGAMIWRAAVVATRVEGDFALRWAAISGALLFAFSDTLIGLNRFVTPLPAAGIPIILTYWAGQWLIALAGRSYSRRAHT
jgi:uncharacterized membrane protein YhhN